jgi:5-methylcytosine-specific restriction endonuclease McrA
LHADHQIPVVERPDLRLDLDNLRTRCDRCHRAKTVRETAGTGRGVISLAPIGSTTTRNPSVKIRETEKSGPGALAGEVRR